MKGDRKDDSLGFYCRGLLHKQEVNTPFKQPSKSHLDVSCSEGRRFHWAAALLRGRVVKVVGAEAGLS